MKRIVVLAIFSSLLGLCEAKKVVETKWELEKYQNPDSIYILDYRYDSQGKLFYMISNDSANLYIHTKFVEEQSQMTFLMGGFNIWLDLNAKGKKRIGIKYPLAQNDRETFPSDTQGPPSQDGDTFTSNTQGPPSRDRDNTSSLKKEDLDKLTDIALVNFPNEAELFYISTLEKHPIQTKLSLNQHSGHLYYTLKIPYNIIGLDYTSGRIISLILESGELEGTQQNNERPDNMDFDMENGMGGPPSGGGGGMGGPPSGGGGMSGGSGPQAGGGASSTNSSSQIRIKIKRLQLQ